MPLTGEYSEKVHKAYEATQAKGGMNKKNLKKLQKLLKYYPQSKDLEVDGFYGEQTIEAVNSFYDNYYWTEERRMNRLIDLHGEKYIMQSELEGMKADSTKY
jgi:lysozyme family protein